LHCLTFSQLVVLMSPSSCRPIGFSFWSVPGPFVQFLGIRGAAGRFAGFVAVLPKAAFAYVGSEIVSVAAGGAHPFRAAARRLT